MSVENAKRRSTNITPRRTLGVFTLLLPLAMGWSSPAGGQVNPIREEAMNNPHKHAWDLFLLLNHPASSPSAERGTFDPSKKIGDPGPVVWETWKLAGTEVFLPDGSKPPPWNDRSLEGGSIEFKTFEAPKPVLLRALSEGMPVEKAATLSLSNMKGLLSVDPDDGTFNPTNFSGGGETRMNKATFEFIVDPNNELYNVEGQEKLFSDVAAGRRKPLSFPVDSIEVKAMWLPLSAKEIQEGKGKRYHLGKDKNGNTFGLLALHIITKDVPNWFWCSFHQIDGKKPLVPTQDDYGRPALLAGTEWEYYALSGTQTDFVDAAGRATLLSDPHIENGFERSSCITCHAQATIGAPIPGSKGVNRLPVFQIQRTSPDFLLPPPGFPFPPNYAAVGVPYADQYFDSRGRTEYAQLDFLFSLHIRANRKKGPK